MKISVKNADGSNHSEIEIGFDIITDGRGSQAVHDAVVGHLAAKRHGTASTKTMGEVAGTGKKPWRQKGTGRARAGSFQSPLWRGGGVTFGPQPRSFAVKVGKKTKTLALKKALSARLIANDVHVVEKLELNGPKTKEASKLLSSMSLTGTTLIIDSKPQDALLLATRNLPLVHVVSASTVDAYQVLRPDAILISRAAFEELGKKLVENS